MGWTTKESCFDPWPGKEILLFATASCLALAHTQPVVLGGSGGSFCRDQAAEARSWPPSSSTQIKNEWSWTSTPPYALMACMWTTLSLHLLLWDFTVFYCIRRKWASFYIEPEKTKDTFMCSHQYAGKNQCINKSYE